MLSDITQVKPNSFETSASGSPSCPGPSNYVFEIHCHETVYYVGENPAIGASASLYSSRSFSFSQRSGTGLEQAQSWETAIRQARLPLSTRPSSPANEQSSSAVKVGSHQPGTEFFVVTNAFVQECMCPGIVCQNFENYVHIFCLSFLACNSRLPTIRRPHPPHRPVLGHIHCFMQCEIMDLRSCCTVLSHVMQGRPRGLRFSGGRVDRILLASVLSSIHA